MSGFFVILISLGYVIIGAVIYAIIYALTYDDFEGALASLLWPTLIIVIPLGLFINFIVEKIKNKIKNG